MKFNVETVRANDPRYQEVIERYPDANGSEYLTIVKFRPPGKHRFSDSAIKKVNSLLDDFIVGHCCGLFEEVRSADQFFHDNILSGGGAIHLMFGHVFLTVLRNRKHNILIHQRRGLLRRKDEVKDISEWVYRPDPKNRYLIAVVYTGRYHPEAFKHALVRMHKRMMEVLAYGTPIEGESPEPMETTIT